MGNVGVEEAGAARGEPVWFQLYPTDQWPIAKALVKRVEAAGCPALVLTVDLQGGTNRVTGERARRLDRRDCASCHGESLDRFDAYLVEVVDGVQGKLPVLVDGGFRRGTDVFKALALGATAVCVGRPYVWGLAAFGQAGVESVLGILRRELLTVMRQAGTRRIAEIDRSYVVRSGDRQD